MAHEILLYLPMYLFSLTCSPGSAFFKSIRQSTAISQSTAALPSVRGVMGNSKKAEPTSRSRCQLCGHTCGAHSNVIRKAQCRSTWFCDCAFAVLPEQVPRRECAALVTESLAWRSASSTSLWFGPLVSFHLPTGFSAAKRK